MLDKTNSLFRCSFGWLFCLYCVLGSASISWAVDDSICKELFRKKSYERAAQCFQDKATPLLKKSKRNTQDAGRVYGLLRNASLSLRKAAKQEKSAQRSSYLREQSLQIVNRILTQKYYASASQKRVVVFIQKRLLDRIGYVRVTILTGTSPAKLRITGGFKFADQEKKTKKWVLTLRPGNYTITATYTKTLPQVKSLSLKGGQAPPVLAFEPRKPSLKKPIIPNPPQSSALPWIVVGIGSALVVGGGALLVASFVSNGDAVNKAETLQKSFNSGQTVNSTEVQGVTSGHNTANTLYLTGWIAGGAGLAAVVVGVVLYTTRPRNTPTKQTKTPLVPKTTTFFVSQ